jgi:hypothetical protein
LLISANEFTTARNDTAILKKYAPCRDGKMEGSRSVQKPAFNSYRPPKAQPIQSRLDVPAGTHDGTFDEF